MVARSSLLRRPTPGARPARRTSSVVAALAALAPRLVRLARHDYPDRLLGGASPPRTWECPLRRPPRCTAGWTCIKCARLMPTWLNDRAAAAASAAEGVRRTRQASLTELLSGLADARGNGAGAHTTIMLSTHDRSDPTTVISTGRRRLRAAASPSGGRARSTGS